MALTLSDFISDGNIVTSLDERLYDQKDVFIETARSFSRSFYQPVFIVDLYKQDLLYISGNMSYLCGISKEEFQAHKDRLYFEYVPEEEEDMLKEIIQKAFMLFNEQPVKDKQNWTLSYYFHLQNNNRKKLIFNKITPLKLAPNGQIWLALCTCSMSSRKEAGHPVMRCYGHEDYFYYSLKKHVWYYREGVILTDIEKDILMLSLQGFTMKEIAVRFCKSEDTVKSYKRLLFAKLGVKSITEAVGSAINNDHLC